MPIKRRRKESQTENKKPKSQYFKYFVETNNKRKKVCKNAFLILHQIKRSRLEVKIQQNREISEDLRGKHGNNWNCLPQEVVEDILDFIENLPARESHYSPKTEKNRKYLSSDLNVSKLHQKFIDLYHEYEKVVSYEFFKNYFKKFNLGFGFPRNDICGDCELFNVQIKSSKSESEIISLKNKFKAHQTEAEMFYKIQKEIKSLTINDNTGFLG